MSVTPSRIFLDTNIYIIGVADPDSYESRILEWIGYREKKINAVEIIVSEELVTQILRVSKRLQNKDWGSELLARIWQNLNICYVLLDSDEFSRVEALGVIPREDVGVYLTAKTGKAECFISANYKLIRALAKQTGEFECLTPEEFVKQYLV